MKPMKIKDMNRNLRPRERLMSCRVENLSDYELLALILQSGTKAENVLDMSRRILSEIGLSKLSQMDIREIIKIKGFGIAKASVIVAAFELIKRIKNRPNHKRILSCDDVYELCYDIRDSKKEMLVVLHLNSRNKLIEKEIVGIGTLDTVLIHPREIFRSAINNSASSIILVHNHPSGDAEPSDEDIRITETIHDAGQLIGIKLLDHVIITREKKFSFKEKEILTTNK